MESQSTSETLRAQLNRLRTNAGQEPVEEEKQQAHVSIKV